MRRICQARVIVVDNASRDGTPEMIRAQFPRVELIAREDNLGFAGGNNLGCGRCGFDHGDAALHPARSACLLLNPDTEVQPRRDQDAAGYVVFTSR